MMETTWDLRSCIELQDKSAASLERDTREIPRPNTTIKGSIISLGGKSGKSLGQGKIQSLISMGEIQMSIENVKTKHQDWLMSLPNVMGVAIGQKNGSQVIKVFVTGKVLESTLRPDEIIPKTLEGYEVDVEEIKNITLQA
jgi:hypothetical protein